MAPYNVRKKLGLLSPPDLITPSANPTHNLKSTTLESNPPQSPRSILTFNINKRPLRIPRMYGQGYNVRKRLGLLSKKTTQKRQSAMSTTERENPEESVTSQEKKVTVSTLTIEELFAQLLSSISALSTTEREKPEESEISQENKITVSTPILEVLPVEIQVDILKALSKVSDLSALVHASPRFHAVYLTQRRRILFEVLYNQLGREAVHWACIILAICTRRPGSLYSRWHQARYIREDENAVPRSYFSSMPSLQETCTRMVGSSSSNARLRRGSISNVRTKLLQGQELELDWPDLGPVGDVEWAVIRQRMRQGTDMEDLFGLVRLGRTSLQPWYHSGVWSRTAPEWYCAPENMAVMPKWASESDEVVTEPMIKEGRMVIYHKMNALLSTSTKAEQCRAVMGIGWELVPSCGYHFFSASSARQIMALFEGLCYLVSFEDN